jgi:hypothetical protein
MWAGSYLPTDVDGMLAYLLKNGNGVPGDMNGLGKDILNLASDHFLRPKARAALFQVAAKIPGLAVVKNAKDGAGRSGVGIAWARNCATRGKPDPAKV